MADLSVAVIGLGRLGASVGMALSAYNTREDATNHFTVVGVEPNSRLAKTARDKGAVDKVVSGVHDAVRDRDLVVVAAPYAEIEDTYRDMAGGLRDGAVVLDFSPLKLPSIAWAERLLRDAVHVAGATAVVNPAYLWDGLNDTEHAQADYFKNGSIILAPDAKIAPDALELVTVFSRILGADVHYADPHEHDGVAGATEGVPAVLGLALFRTLSQDAGWTEIQRLTNPAFGRVTHRLMDTHPDDLRDLLLNNRENTVRHLDAVLETLHELRDALDENDANAVEAATVDTEERYRKWIKQRSQGKWDDVLDQQPETQSGGILSGLLGGFLGDKLTGGKNNKGDH